MREVKFGVKKIGILGALSEFWKPHFFGILGALKFGRMGVHPENIALNDVRVLKNETSVLPGNTDSSMLAPRKEV